MRISTTLLAATLSFVAPGLEAASVPTLEKRKVIKYEPICIDSTWKKSLFTKKDMATLAQNQITKFGITVVPIQPSSILSDKSGDAFYCILNPSHEILYISGTNISASMSDVLDSCCKNAGTTCYGGVVQYNDQNGSPLSLAIQSANDPCILTNR